MDLGIAGRNAIVCAASKGLGKACAMSLGRECVELVINSRTAETLEATAEEIRKDSGAKVTVVASDITTREGQAAVLKALPNLDILVNNAGGPPPGNLRDWEREDWIKALDANLPDQGDHRRHDRAQVRPHRQYHLAGGAVADRGAGPFQRRAAPG